MKTTCLTHEGQARMLGHEFLACQVYASLQRRGNEAWMAEIWN